MGRGSRGPATNWSAWRRPLVHVAIVVAFVFSVLGYPLIKKSGAEPQRPQQAGQPINPYVTASHIASVRVNVLARDTRGAEAHANALAQDLARSARLPDTTRPIDHEAARAALRQTFKAQQ